MKKTIVIMGIVLCSFTILPSKTGKVLMNCNQNTSYIRDTIPPLVDTTMQHNMNDNEGSNKIDTTHSY